MSFHICFVFGGTESNPPLDRLEDLYADLELADQEHTDVSVEHESGWGLSAFPGGRLIWENVEGDGPACHMTGVPREKVLELWAKLTRGQIEAIASEPWLPGYF